MSGSTRQRVLFGTLVLGALLLALAIALVVASGRVPNDSGQDDTGQEEWAAPRLVAHAGGAVDGRTYTNSRDALDRNHAAGHRVFELDLHFTSDDRLVLVHDWTTHYRELFENPTPGPPTRAEFAALSMVDGLRQMTLDDLFEWLDAHPDAQVVTDVKRDNLRALEIIRSAYAHAPQRMIPQIYDLANYGAVRNLGFDRIILTLYRTRATNDKILAFAEAHDAFAYTMLPRRGAWQGLAAELASRGEVVYFHTVNTWQEAAALTELGAYGFYTDTLIPPDLPPNELRRTRRPFASAEGVRPPC